MEIEGIIIQKLDPVSGVSKAGNNWSKQEYILETAEAYPKKICFDFFGDRASQYPLEVGDRIKLSFDIESREYQGRWFTSIRGWKAEKVVPGAEKPAAAPAPAANPQMMGAAPAGPAPTGPAPVGPADIMGETQQDDLPF